jgi:hypothetical protein
VCVCVYKFSKQVSLLKLNIFRLSSNCMKFREIIVWVLIYAV